MARNEEKNLAGLNRLHLKSLAEKEKKKTRPPLSQLKTSDEIREWIPSIKTEINFCLRHLSGIRNYPDHKIKEFKQRLEKLQKEHQRFVAKCKALDPDKAKLATPGDLHSYISKHQILNIRENEQQEEVRERPLKRKRKDASEIPTPLLSALESPACAEEEGDDRAYRGFKTYKKAHPELTPTPGEDPEQHPPEGTTAPPIFLAESINLHDHQPHLPQNQPLQFGFVVNHNGETSLVPYT
eukprot:TRINITY_DN18361_c0_g1_i1.p1 TRINITY_DN18361_c0_g1~~TRINITY_DN18361_c0_g1_i1.p1  ORF type:complete len:240 (+),score=61.83 TRINITY_DN18361_c0_g1_i1:3-722(+)